MQDKIEMNKPEQTVADLLRDVQEKIAQSPSNSVVTAIAPNEEQAELVLRQLSTKKIKASRSKNVISILVN